MILQIVLLLGGLLFLFGGYWIFKRGDVLNAKALEFIGGILMILGVISEILCTAYGLYIMSDNTIHVQIEVMK